MARIGELIGPNGEVMHPKTSASVVYLEDGRSVEQVLSDDIDYGNVVFQDNSYKFDSDVEDDFAKTVVIKGQTYQNILPEPSTHVLTNNKEMFKVNEGLDPNVEIVDGVSKSAILKGNTLVNLMTNCKDEYVVRYYATNNPNNNVANISMMKPNTEYTLFYKAKYRTEGEGAGTSGFLKIATSIEKGFIFTNQSLTTEYEQYIYRFTTSSVVDCFVFSSTDKYFAIKECVLLEGDYTQEDVPYFTGMSSCKMPVLTTTGKNLFYVTKSNGYYSYSNGNWVNDGGFKTLSARVLPNTKYTQNIERNNITFWKDGVFVSGIANSPTFTTPTNCNEVRVSCPTNFETFMLEMGKVATAYEPYKSNILSTPEEVVLRSVENAQDTIDLNTGEYVQRIGEVILNGSESWQVLDNNTENTIGFALRRVLPLRKTGDKYVKVNCDKFPSYKENLWKNDKIGCVAENNINQDLNDTQLQVRVLKSALSTQDTNGFKSWLQTNPLTIQYILETPVVKTLDLSSSRNWMELTLTGEEEWRDSGNTPYITPSVQPKKGVIPFSNGEFVGVDRAESFACFWLGGGTNTPNGNLVFYHPMVKNAIQMKEFLRNNPQKIYYYVEDGMGCIKQPIFFKDGHIQLSSGVENSLIPTLDYQAKTSNSYVIDLIKDGHTTYTIKADSASGSLIFSNGSVTLTGNNKFTTPNKYDHKFAILDGSWSNPMIIEGDQTDKDIPYFTGIKSSFENDHPLEMVSESANKWKGKTQYLPNGTTTTLLTHEDNECVFEHKCVNQGIRINITEFQYQTITLSYDIEILDGVALNIGGHNRHQGIATYIDGVKVNCSYHNGYVMPYEKNRKYHIDAVFNINLPVYEGPNGDRECIGIEPNRYSNDNPTYCKMRVTNFQITLGETPKTYEEPKVSHTKIPLLSPLRSLPNGVCDELIIDRMKNKATLIQRVGEIYATTSYMSASYFSTSSSNNYRNEKSCAFLYNLKDTVLPFNRGETRGGAIVCEGLPSYNGNTWNTSIYTCAISGVNSSYDFCFRFPNSETLITLNDSDDMVRKQFNRHLDNKNMKLLYELKTPIITEVDLEGFPYIYKDGHVFINSEIAPTVGIEYGINQGHRIEGQVETLQRHEKQFTQLERYFADLIYSDYNFALLRFNEGLR